MFDKSILISCTCGCGTILEIKSLDDLVFISISESVFYAKQQVIKNYICDKIKGIYKKINKKKTIDSEIMITKDTFKSFIDTLKNIKLEDNFDEINNDSYLKVEPIIFDNKLYEYSICLVNKQSLTDYIFNEHRAYEITFDKKRLNNFIKKCEKILKETEKYDTYEL
jgi:hypothetical protein